MPPLGRSEPVAAGVGSNELHGVEVGASAAVDEGRAVAGPVASVVRDVAALTGAALDLRYHAPSGSLEDLDATVEEEPLGGR